MMCGRFNVIDSPEVQWLCEILGIKLNPEDYSNDCAPGSQVAIVRDTDQGRNVTNAVWWLMLDFKTLKPNYKYASFNSRSDKLNIKRSIGYKPYRESRCIIPASAFAEGLGDKKTYYKVELEKSAIAFGGLCKEYFNQDTGEVVTAASIITLPPLQAWEKIHPKSMPLLLPFEDKATIDKWLDPEFQNVEEFEPLLDPVVGHPQIITKIGKPSQWNPIEESFRISASVTAQN